MPAADTCFMSAGDRHMGNSEWGLGGDGELMALMSGGPLCRGAAGDVAQELRHEGLKRTGQAGSDT